MLNNDIKTISASEKFIKSLQTLNSVKVSADCYNSDDFGLASGSLNVRSISSKGGSADLIDISGFVLARLSIEKPSQLPNDFECHLLIANSKALPFIDKYRCKYFILSEPLENSEHITEYLAQRNIIYLGDCYTNIALINGKLQQKNDFINTLFK